MTTDPREAQKMQVARAALAFVREDSVLGVGTGSTVNCFIDALAKSGKRIEAAGGSLFRPNLYFGEYYDLPSLTVRTERVRRELGLEPTPLDEGLRETFLSYQATSAGAEPDFAWYDRLIASMR